MYHIFVLILEKHMCYLLAVTNSGALLGPALILLILALAALALWLTRSPESRAKLRKDYGSMGPIPPAHGAGD